MPATVKVHAPDLWARQVTSALHEDCRGQKGPDGDGRMLLCRQRGTMNWYRLVKRGHLLFCKRHTVIPYKNISWESHGNQWETRSYHRIPWYPVDINWITNGEPWESKGSHCFQYVYMVNHGNPMGFNEETYEYHGIQWYPVDINGITSVKPWEHNGCQSLL